MFIFKYFEDKILRNEGEGFTVTALVDFLAANPAFPIVEGEYFEYGERNGFAYFDLIHNFNGTFTHLPRNIAGVGVQLIINAINALEE